MLVHVHIYHVGWRPDPLYAAWLGEGWDGGKAGKCPSSGAGKGTPAQQGCLGAQGGSDPSQSSSLVLSGSLAQAKRDFFSLCMLTFGWFLWFVSQVLHVCTSHQRPWGSPQFSFTLPAKVSQQRGAPTMPLLTLAVRHLPLPLLYPGQSGNS